jgi:putative flippase GtrA
MVADTPRSRLHALVALGWMAARFALVGLANTAVGFGVIMVLQFGFRAPPHLANAGGYAVGFVVSFTLNRRFTFADQGPLGPTAVRFAMAALVAFALNQAVLSVATAWVGHGAGAPVIAQGLAAVSYTVSLFVLCRLWVFRARSQMRLQSRSLAGANARSHR